jgi:ribosomal protein S18 acetylase RimI-like enzyme
VAFTSYFFTFPPPAKPDALGSIHIVARKCEFSPNAPWGSREFFRRPRAGRRGYCGRDSPPPQPNSGSVEPRFRPPDDRDLDAILAFMRQFRIDDPDSRYRHVDEDAARRSLARLMRDPSLGRLWMICDGDTPVGYLALTFGYSLEFHGRDAFVDELFIAASHRGRGWGRRALRHAEAACREDGVKALLLEVTPDNTAAATLYRTSGFEDHDRRLMSKRIVREI